MPTDILPFARDVMQVFEIDSIDRSSISTTAENFGAISCDEGRSASSGCGGVVFALSDESNHVTFVVYGTRREIAMNTTVAKAESKNEIVVYQPNETTRLDVRLRDDTVWLSQRQMSELFGCSSDNIGLHLKNIYADGELDGAATAEDFSVVRKDAGNALFAMMKMKLEPDQVLALLK